MAKEEAIMFQRDYFWGNTLIAFKLNSVLKYYLKFYPPYDHSEKFSGSIMKEKKTQSNKKIS